MKRTSSIEALLRKSQATLINLKRDYAASLHQKVVSDDLKVDIKNIFENLRSCLDYLAHELFEGICGNAKLPDRLYFPIRSSRVEFNKVMNRDYVGLEKANKAVFDFLESVQPYNNPWLGNFNQLNNENKHLDLVEQTRTEERHVAVSAPGGGSVSWGPGVTFGGGVSVMGVPIDPRTQLPIPNNQVNTQITTWVDFKFKENGLSAMLFVEDSIKQVQRIFDDLKKHL
jgi:hypothetical protein